MSQKSLNDLSAALVQNIHLFMEHFELRGQNHGRYISMCCPVHHGDNPNGMSILLSNFGNWKCYTHQCHEEWGSRMISLVQAIMSEKSGEKASFRDAVLETHAILKDCEIKSQDYKVHCSTVKSVKNHVIKTICSIPYYKRQIACPPQYYLDQEFHPTTLERHLVGLCVDDYDLEMRGRVVVPIFHPNKQGIIGKIARSLEPHCPICNLYHNRYQVCPETPLECLNAQKWRANRGFLKEYALYNHLNALPYIKKTNAVLIFESPANCWRAEEAGFSNCVATLGSSLSQYQRQLILDSGATKVVIMSDNDHAGQMMRTKVREMCGSDFQIFDVITPTNDLADMPSKEAFNFLHDNIRGKI